VTRDAQHLVTCRACAAPLTGNILVGSSSEILGSSCSAAEMLAAGTVYGLNWRDFAFFASCHCFRPPVRYTIMAQQRTVGAPCLTSCWLLSAWLCLCVCRCASLQAGHLVP